MPHVKLCGITRPEDAELAASVDAWAIGFILWPKSKRAADPAVAAGIARTMRRRLELVGVFVNPTLDEVAHAVEAIGLTHVQLHGDEGPAFCAAVAQRTGARVIKAHGIGSGADIRDIERFHTDLHLLDTARAGGSGGGTGRTWDWRLAAQRHSKVPLLLSGGLTPENVGDGDRRRPPVGRRRRLRGRGRAGRQGSRQGRGVRRRRAAVRGALVTGESAGADSLASSLREHRGGRAPLRALRRPVRPRDADAGARRARGRVARGARRRGLPRGAGDAAARLRRPPDPALPRQATVRGGRPPDLPQARGPAPHRRAQDQQRARPDPARQAHGQAADHRRDRRRPARRGDRHRVRAARARVHRLHGHRGHAPPAAERAADGAARRDRGARSTPGPARSRRPSRRRSATGSPTSAARTT